MVMKKKVLAVMMSLIVCTALFAGCGSTAAETGNATTGNAAAETENIVEEPQDSGPEGSAGDTAVDVHVGSLKGPTSMGLVYLMSQSEKEETADHYTFTMAAAADELLPQIVSGTMDIALVPANVASVLYQKTEGGISVIDINTLGVLYMVSGDDSIQSMEDLQGKTIYLTGKGTTPDYVLQYLLTENNMTGDAVKLEYKSEATEVAALLAEKPEAIGVLPQPFVTSACMQNDALSIVLDLTEEWADLQGEDGSSLVTGVTVVNNSFLQKNPDAVIRFLAAHKESAVYANENTEDAAELAAAYGIIEKAPVAAKALPYCNITYVDGEDMRKALSGYLEVLYEQDASSIGGSLPADDFYYLP